jgi:hypothetical protein
MSDSDSDDDDILLADTGMGGSSSKTLPAPASPLANVDMEALFGDLPELAKMRSSKAVSAFQPDEELLARDFGKVPLGGAFAYLATSWQRSTFMPFMPHSTGTKSTI